MNFIAEIKIMPLKDLLDPQGKAVMGGLASLGFKGVADVRIGKHIQLTLEAENPDQARELAEQATKKLLANPVMEEYTLSVAGA